uniref:Uncharacterized protein n=1 Tax=Phaeomonas parva TaxID=124430 RepID=A0A7S1UDL0_9STRA|mmetsp:Transcript_42583/g.133486  ORF Transcript_42583/g.133486 Transcript_42583/m.133486 type:complete len:285 (+) Transcript_42583:80-934(+)
MHSLSGAPRTPLEPKMLWFLELPDAPLALVFAFLPVPEVGELLLTHKASLGRLGPERTELWKMLFEAHGLRPPSKRARRANSNLRRAFFDVFRAQYPSDFVLLHRLEKCFRGGDSPKQLAALLPPPEFLKVNRQFDLMGGATIVGLAARWRRTRCVQYLVARGSDVNIADDQGFTVLGNAAWGGNLRLVRWLLRNVPDLDLDQQGCTHKTSSCGGKGPHKPEVWAYRKQFFEVAAAITEERRRRERRRAPLALAARSPCRCPSARRRAGRRAGRGCRCPRSAAT